eukprot:3632196-Rhodomonas_salina.1
MMSAQDITYRMRHTIEQGCYPRFDAAPLYLYFCFASSGSSKKFNDLWEHHARRQIWASHRFMQVGMHDTR